MVDEAKLSKAETTMKAQQQQDDLKAPREIDIVGSRKGEEPQDAQDGTGRPVITRR